ncbi:ATP-binding cassette domain-containing protein [bacterium]|jgi:ABC-2 type transport system ATP-binding protein|nr:ATP-binding cassette domain-containing protein [bacterium]
MSTEAPVLILENLRKTFGSFTAVDGVSLTVPRGSVYGFLGPNGAGKTTTLRMALSIYQPTAGSIRVLGRPSALEVRHRIGYLPEERGLYKKMRARDIIAYFASLKGMPTAAARARADELLERYGLAEFARYRCEALSKGMGQKVQVLATIAHAPEFVILDEPFSGLDPVNQQVLEELIDDLRRAGTTIIFSTHIMEHAERLCDRLVLIARGRAVFDGTLSEARRMIPRRILLRTTGDPDGLRQVPGVVGIERLADDQFELTLTEDGEPDAVLAACFQNGLPLLAFDRSEPTLRDVFLRLVGPADAVEEVA